MRTLLTSAFFAIFSTTLIAADYEEYTRSWLPGWFITHENAIAGIRRNFQWQDNNRSIIPERITNVDQKLSTATIYFSVKESDNTNSERIVERSLDCTYDISTWQWTCVKSQNSRSDFFGPASYVLVRTTTTDYGGAYDAEAERIMLEKAENRKQLAEADLQAVNTLLSKLPAGKTSGELFTSPDFVIEYIKSPNIFMVEIKTIEIERAKKAVVDWFAQQGMSQDAICNYPIDMYVSGEVKEHLEKERVAISTIPTGCS
jgi:hypothetical protein